MKLYLVRHGECTGNTKHRFSFPDDDLTDDTMVIANIIQDPKTSQYKAILHKSNVNPDNYYGNKRKI